LVSRRGCNCRKTLLLYVAADWLSKIASLVKTHRALARFDVRAFDALSFARPNQSVDFSRIISAINGRLFEACDTDEKIPSPV